MGLTRFLAVAGLVSTAAFVVFATYSALFGGYPWLAILPLVFLPAIWYVVRWEGGIRKMAARWIADDERSWRNPQSVNLQFNGPRLIVAFAAATVLVSTSWPDPVSRWVLTLALGALTAGMAGLEMRAWRGTSGHEVDLLHVAGDSETYVAVCRTCSWIGTQESTVDAASAGAADHSRRLVGLVEGHAIPRLRVGRYTRPELRRFWNEATGNGAR
jgi:hypothetical protein